MDIILRSSNIKNFKKWLDPDEDYDYLDLIDNKIRDIKIFYNFEYGNICLCGNRIKTIKQELDIGYGVYLEDNKIKDVSYNVKLTIYSNIYTCKNKNKYLYKIYYYKK